MSEINVIKRNHHVFGIYDDLNLAIDYIYSCLQLKIISILDNITINKYKINTSIILKEIKIDLNYYITKKESFNASIFFNDENKSIEINNKVNEIENSYLSFSDSNDNIESDNISIKTNSSELRKNKIINNKNNKEYIKQQNELGQTKIDIMHNINILKQEQAKIKEANDIFNNDLTLYNVFKKAILKNKDFVIPFLFQTKYDLFIELENKDKLDFNNFKLMYKKEKINTTYDSLFIRSDSDTDDHNIENYSNEITDELINNINPILGTL